MVLLVLKESMDPVDYLIKQTNKQNPVEIKAVFGNQDGRGLQ